MKTMNIVRIALITLAILLVPFIAMQFTSEVNWDLFDFVVAGSLLFGSGLVYEFATRNTNNTKRKIIIGAVVFVVLALIWIELAVGLFGTPFAGS